jgi:hypothetical protein
MATKSSNKGAKARTRGSKGAVKTGAKKSAKKAAQKGAKTTRAGASKAAKATKAAQAKPAARKATKARSKAGAALIGTVPGGTQISDIQIVPYNGADAEDSIACRSPSPLNLFPDIISMMNTDNDPADGKLRLILILNEGISILPAAFGCNDDGLIYLPAQSVNIASIGGPEYLGKPIKRIRVKIFSPNPQQVLPFTFAFRLRFTTLAGFPLFPKPFRKRGSIKVR